MDTLDKLPPPAELAAELREILAHPERLTHQEFILARRTLQLLEAAAFREKMRTLSERAQAVLKERGYEPRRVKGRVQWVATNPPPGSRLIAKTRGAAYYFSPGHIPKDDPKDEGDEGDEP